MQVEGHPHSSTAKRQWFPAKTSDGQFCPMISAVLFSYRSFSQACDTEKILQVLTAIRPILYVELSQMITSDIVGS